MEQKTIELEYDHGIFCVAFVYSRNNGSVVIKGEYSDVKRLINKEYSPSVVNETFWRKGVGWSIWKVYGSREFWINYPKRPSHVLNSNRRNKFEFYSFDKRKIVFSLRRIPKRWIPEYDEFLL